MCERKVIPINPTRALNFVISCSSNRVSSSCLFGVTNIYLSSISIYMDIINVYFSVCGVHCRRGWTLLCDALPHRCQGAATGYFSWVSHQVKQTIRFELDQVVQGATVLSGMHSLASSSSSLLIFILPSFSIPFHLISFPPLPDSDHWCTCVYV